MDAGDTPRHHAPGRAQRMTAHIRKPLGLAARLAITGVVVGYLLHRMNLEHFHAALAATLHRWPWLMAALGLMGTVLVLCAWRWLLILRGLEIRPGWWRVLAVSFVGDFFNTFMLGATGGDVVKACYIVRETPQHKTRAVTSILIDRVVGMLALCLMVAVMILVQWRLLMGHPETRIVSRLALAVTGGVLLLSALAFGLPVWQLLPFLNRWEARPKIGRVVGILHRAYDACHVFRTRPWLLAGTLAMSLGLQVCAVVATLCVGQALELRVPFIEYLTFCPLVGLISSLPITPGGLGIREGSAVHLLAAIGVTPDHAFLVAFLPYLCLLIWGLVGGVVFLGYSTRGPCPATEPNPS